MLSREEPFFFSLQYTEGRADKEQPAQLESKAKEKIPALVTIRNNYLESPAGRILDQTSFFSANQTRASFTNVGQVGCGAS